MTDLERANLFWERARKRVLCLAQKYHIKISIAEHDDSFLFDLYDCGDYTPTDEEIISALIDYEAERDIDAKEAEFGADGYLVFGRR